MEEESAIFESFESRLQFIYKYALKTDIKFFVGSEDDDFIAVFSAHSFVLSTCSQYFNSIFNTPDAKNTLHIKNYSARIFKQVLRYIYTDKMNIVTPTEYIETYKLAKEFSILNLIKELRKCGEIFAINRENIKFWLDAAKLLDDSDIVERCFQFIQGHADEIINDKSFYDMESSIFKRITSSPDVPLESEVVMLRALCEWAKYNVGKEEFSEKTLKQLTDEHLNFIYFPSLAAHEFFHITKEYPDNFTEEEIYDVYEALSDRTVKNKPKWMTRTQKRVLPDQLPVLENFVVPSVFIKTYYFPILLEQEETETYLDSLETILKVVPTKPLFFLGFTLICPDTEVDETVTLRWKFHLSGFYEPLLNEMEYAGHVCVENSTIEVTFPELVPVDSTTKLELSIQIKYQNTKGFYLPKSVAPLSRYLIFIPYGRNPHFDGNAIVSKLHYL